MAETHAVIKYSSKDSFMLSKDELIFALKIVYPDKMSNIEVSIAKEENVFDCYDEQIDKFDKLQKQYDDLYKLCKNITKFVSEDLQNIHDTAESVITYLESYENM